MMNRVALLICLSLFGCEAAEKTAATTSPQSPQQEYYLLKTWHFDSPEQQTATGSFVEQAWMPAIHRLGIEPVGVFEPRPEQPKNGQQLVALIPLTSLADLDMLEQRLLQDSLFLADGAAYLNAPHDQPPFRDISSVVMKAFTDMPAMATPGLTSPREDRVYELRSYESPTEALYHNKVDMFNAGGEVLLFDQLGFNAVFYGEVLAGADMPNLMYMTTHADTATRQLNWKAFVESPKWDSLINDPQYQHNVSHADIYLLRPTSYSDY